MVAKKKMRGGGMAKMASKKMRGGGVAAKKMRGGGMAKMASKEDDAWRGCEKEMRKKLVHRFAIALLNIGKPFTRIGNWFWKKHRDVLDWNDK
jgi:hypothetical protein